MIAACVCLDAITKEEAEMSSVTGVFIQGCFVKGTIAYVGFYLGMLCGGIN